MWQKVEFKTYSSVFSLQSKFKIYQADNAAAAAVAVVVVDADGDLAPPQRKDII